MNSFDLTKTTLREVNQKLQSLPADTNEKVWHLNNLHGEHDGFFYARLQKHG